MKIWRSVIVRAKAFPSPKKPLFHSCLHWHHSRIDLQSIFVCSWQQLKKKKNRTSWSHVCIAKQCCVMGADLRLRLLLLSNQSPHSNTSDRSAVGSSCHCWCILLSPAGIMALGRNPFQNAPGLPHNGNQTKEVGNSQEIHCREQYWA